MEGFVEIEGEPNLPALSRETKPRTTARRAVSLALGLRVTTAASERASRSRALARTAVKFVPWELAHTALWHTPGWPLRPEPTLLHGVAYAGSLLLAGWYVASLFIGDRRTPYDRVAGTRVVRG